MQSSCRSTKRTSNRNAANAVVSGIGIEKPLPTDVLMGRGPRIASHNNKTIWRTLIRKEKFTYHFTNQRIPAIDRKKREIANRIVEKSIAKGVRFLEQNRSNGLWYISTDRTKIRTKTQQALRDDATKARRDIQKKQKAAAANKATLARTQQHSSSTTPSPVDVSSPRTTTNPNLFDTKESSRHPRQPPAVLGSFSFGEPLLNFSFKNNNGNSCLSTSFTSTDVIDELMKAPVSGVGGEMYHPGRATRKGASGRYAISKNYEDYIQNYGISGEEVLSIDDIQVDPLFQLDGTDNAGNHATEIPPLLLKPSSSDDDDVSSVTDLKTRENVRVVSPTMESIVNLEQFLQESNILEQQQNVLDQLQAAYQGTISHVSRAMTICQEKLYNLFEDCEIHEQDEDEEEHIMMDAIGDPIPI